MQDLIKNKTRILTHNGMQSSGQQHYITVDRELTGITGFGNINILESNCPICDCLLKQKQKLIDDIMKDM